MQRQALAYNPPRRTSRPRLVQGGFDLFEPAAPAPPHTTLDLGVGGGGFATDWAGKQRRLVALERQRDVLRAQGWATADLDAHIDMLTRSLRESWNRNPRLPPGSRPAYSGWHYSPRNKVFRGPDGVYHPLRRNLQAQGIYDPEIEARRRQLKGVARREGWLPPSASGTMRRVVRTTRSRAERLASEAAAESEVAQGSFEQRYGIARPTDVDVRGLRARMGHPVRTRGSTTKPLLSERDVLRLAAVARQVDPDLNLAQQDWWDDLSWDDYRQAVGKARLSFTPAELGVGPSGTVTRTAREAHTAERQAAALERMLDPWEGRQRAVEDRLQRALDAMGQATTEAQAKQAMRRVERLETEMRALGQGPGRRQRAENPRVFDLPELEPRRRMSVGRTGATIEEVPDAADRFYHGARRYTVTAPLSPRSATRYEGPFTTTTRPGEYIVGTADTYRGALQLVGQAAPSPRRSSRARVVIPGEAAQLQLFNPAWRRDNPGALLLAALGAAAVGIAAVVWWRRDRTPDWVRHAALTEHHRQHPTLPEDPRVGSVRWHPQGLPPALSGPGWEVLVREAGTEWGYLVDTSGIVRSM